MKATLTAVLSFFFTVMGMTATTVQVDWERGTEYYTAASVQSGNYLPFIYSITDITEAIGDRHDYQVSDCEIQLLNVNRVFSNMIDDRWGSKIIGKRVTISDSAGSTIRKMYIERYSFSNNMHVFSIYCTDASTILRKSVIPAITQEAFPDAAFDAFGQPINRIFKADLMPVKCWRVTSDPYYLVSDHEIQSITGIQEAGSWIVGGWSLISDGTYWYIDYAAGTEDYIYVTGYSLGLSGGNVVGTIAGAAAGSRGLYQELMYSYFQDYGGETWNNDTMDAYFDWQNRSEFYSIQDRLTGAEILKQLCDSYNTDWIVDVDGNIDFIYYDIPTLLSGAEQFDENEVIDFSLQNVDETQVINSLTANYAYQDGGFTKANVFSAAGLMYPDREQVYNFSIDYYCLDGLYSASERTALAHIQRSAKIEFIMNAQPKIVCMATVPISRAIGKIGQFVKFQHRDAITTDSRYYQIREIRLALNSGTAALVLWDYTYLNGFDWDSKLLLHSNTYDGDRLHFDWAPDGWNTISTAVMHSTDDSRFGNSSIEFPSLTGGKINAVNSTVNPGSIGNHNNYTADLWFKIDAAGSTYLLIGGYFNATNYWNLKKLAANTFLFEYVAGGVTEISITSTATLTDTTQWHHIALVRAGGTAIGVYLDGVQILYTATTPTAVDLSGIVLGKNQISGSELFFGYMDEIHVSFANTFSASPVVGLTDTVTPPVLPYYWNVSDVTSAYLTTIHHAHLTTIAGDRLIVRKK